MCSSKKKQPSSWRAKPIIRRIIGTHLYLALLLLKITISTIIFFQCKWFKYRIFKVLGYTGRSHEVPLVFLFVLTPTAKVIPLTSWSLPCSHQCPAAKGRPPQPRQDCKTSPVRFQCKLRSAKGICKSHSKGKSTLISSLFSLPTASLCFHILTENPALETYCLFPHVWTIFTVGFEFVLLPDLT